MLDGMSFFFCHRKETSTCVISLVKKFPAQTAHEDVTVAARPVALMNFVRRSRLHSSGIVKKKRLCVGRDDVGTCMTSSKGQSSSILHLFEQAVSAKIASCSSGNKKIASSIFAQDRF